MFSNVCLNLLFALRNKALLVVFDSSSVSTQSSSVFWGHRSVWQGIFHTYNLHHKYNFKVIILNLIGPPALMDSLFPQSLLLAVTAFSLKTLFEVSYWPPTNFFCSYIHKWGYCLWLSQSTVEARYSCLRHVNQLKSCHVARVKNILPVIWSS